MKAIPREFVFLKSKLFLNKKRYFFIEGVKFKLKFMQTLDLDENLVLLGKSGSFERKYCINRVDNFSKISFESEIEPIKSREEHVV